MFPCVGGSKAALLSTGVKLATHRNEFISDGLDRAGDVLIKSGVTRLKHGHIIFLSSHKQIWRVYLANVKDSVDGDFNWGWIRNQRGWSFSFAY